MYNISAYGEMIAEPIRRQAYAEALERAIRPGCVVLDLGTGPGYFALVAARLGARKVYGVDSSPSIELAAQLAAANGLSERVELFRGVSTEIELPEKADVIVSDLRGILPPFQDHIPSIIDARERLLAPGGVLIPQQDVLWATLVEAGKVYSDLTRGWGDDSLGFDLRIPRQLVTNEWRKTRVAAEQCLVEARRWATLDYREIESPAVAGRVDWQIARPAEAHGLAIWFDTVLGDGIAFSNAPDQPALLYGQGFFPFPEPVELHSGDRIAVDLRAVPVGGDTIWSWKTLIERAAGKRQRFDQSTFHGTPLAPASLHKHAATFVPSLNHDGSIQHFVLSRFDGRTPLETIARDLHAAFPALFPHWRDALTRVGELAETYGEEPGIDTGG